MHPSKLAFVFALLPLAGCETLGLSSPPPAYPDETGAVTAQAAPGPTFVAEPCPQSAVLAETSRLVMLRGTGTANADVMMSAEISPPRLECDYDTSTRRDEIDLSFPLILNKGPASSSDQTQITYFIALVNNAGEVIAKKTYQRAVNFEGKQSFIATEKVEDLVLTLGPGTVPTDHRILIGFQLTPAQLAYNRAKAAVPAPAPVPAAAPTPAPTVSARTPHTRGRNAKPAPGTTTAAVTQPAATTTPAPAAATAPAPAPAPAPAAATATAPATTNTPTAVPAPSPATPVPTTAAAADDGVTRATLPSPYPDDEPDAPAPAPTATPAATPAGTADQPAAAPAAAPAATPTTTPPAGQ